MFSFVIKSFHIGLTLRLGVQADTADPKRNLILESLSISECVYGHDSNYLDHDDAAFYPGQTGLVAGPPLARQIGSRAGHPRDRRGADRPADCGRPQP